VYGDYCSGEIFAWDGSTQSVLLDTTLNISSFGEDEAGELYVVNLGGTVSRIVSGCTYSISPTSQSFAAGGGPGSNVTVTAGAGCAWTAVSNDSWIHITAGANGSGNGSVSYSVDANISTSQRSGTLTIAGKTFTVDQSGVPVCTYSISPTSAKFTRTGGTASVTVTVDSGCAWSAVSNASWIVITSAASGSGDGTVTYSVGSYGGPPKSRGGSITIAGKTLTVKQTK
jgi:hypothetical protein